MLVVSRNLTRIGSLNKELQLPNSKSKLYDLSSLSWVWVKVVLVWVKLQRLNRRERCKRNYRLLELLLDRMKKNLRREGQLGIGRFEGMRMMIRMKKMDLKERRREVLQEDEDPLDRSRRR